MGNRDISPIDGDGIDSHIYNHAIAEIAKMENEVKQVRCAIYTRKSTDENLNSEFNSLDAQREACENYIRIQAEKGWICLPEHYDDGGFSGGNTNRPALQRLLTDIADGKVDLIVIYKLDRLSRSLYDFAGLHKFFEEHNVGFCSVTQEINTSTSSGRMFLSILMAFAEFERSIVTERIRDKMDATRRKGEWVGGTVACGYKVENKKLVVDPERAEVVRRHRRGPVPWHCRWHPVQRRPDRGHRGLPQTDCGPCDPDLWARSSPH